MKPPKKISESEVDLFRKAVADVKPLPQKQLHTPAVVKKPRRRVSEPAQPLYTLEIDDVTPLQPDDLTEFARSGIAARTLAQLRRGSIAPTATLDLHGYKAKPAQLALHEFLHQCRAQGERCVRIIHGKGRGAHDTAPVLKSIVNHWLREQPQVLAFCSAPPNNGGTGAVYVLLKRSPL
jgi:DNA-nicking Smr family endonuclease